MALIDNLVGEFRVSVSRQSGAGISGAYIRVINGEGQDVTTLIAGTSPVQTGGDGLYTARVLKVGALAEGLYTILVSAPGFQAASQQAGNSFVGSGSFAFVLQPVPLGDYLVSIPTGYVSVLLPVVTTITAPPESLTDWQLVQASVIRDDSNGSAIEVSVSPSGEAVLGLTGRLRLKPALHLVGDGLDVIEDPDLFRVFAVTPSIVNDSGSFPIGNNSYEIIAGNVWPSGTTNDLTDYATKDGLAKWLTPFDELPVFAGYYADCAVVLHEAGAYQVHIAYLDGGRMEIDTYTSNPFMASAKKAVKVRIPYNTEAYYAQITILSDSEPVTLPLNVKYV